MRHYLVRTIAGLVAVAALVLGPTAVANAVPLAAAASSLKGVVASSTVVKGASVKATLTASPATSGTSRLQYKSGGKWVTDARSITVTKGKGTTNLKPSADRTYRFSYAGVVSNEVTVKVVAASVKGVVASSTVVKGASVKATLTASPATSGAAKLQYKSGGKWVTDTRTITITKGKGTTTLKPSADRTYRFSYAGAVSNEVTVKVTAPSLKAVAAASSVVKGGSVKATLTASPATSGTAKLQYKSGGKWVTDTRKITITKGKGTTTLKPSADRTYRFSYGGVFSNEVTVKVTAAAAGSFTVKGSGWGHGVGMSQYGAYGMALEGYTASQILTHYFTGTQVESIAANPDIRVQVFGKGTDSTSSVRLVVRSPGTGTDANGGWRMTFAAQEGAAPATTWTGFNDEVLTVDRLGASVKVTRANGTTATAAVVALQWEATSYYASSSPEDPYVELTTSTGAAATHGLYRHGQLLITSLNSRVNVVNVLKLNTEYLLGIAEVPSSWHTEALKAQAIAARGYAVRQVASGVKAACGCHLYDDASSQNFSGWKKESEGTDAYYGKRWVAAVQATSSVDGDTGQVLTYSPGKIATTYYFSSSGGQTENSEQVWASTVSYLRAVEDPWSLAAAVNNPNAAWTTTVSQATMKAAFGLPDVTKVVISKRTSDAATAAAYTLTATSSTGQTATLTGADNIRIKLGVKSPWIWTIAAS